MRGGSARPSAADGPEPEVAESRLLAVKPPRPGLVEAEEQAPPRADGLMHDQRLARGSAGADREDLGCRPRLHAGRCQYIGGSLSQIARFSVSSGLNRQSGCCRPAAVNSSRSFSVSGSSFGGGAWRPRSA